jgi:hypothetical protein
MRKKIFLLTALLIFFQQNIFSQMKIGEVTLPNTMLSGKELLTLNGGGIREKFWMDMYVGGLYLLKKNKNAEEIVNANSAMGIKLHIVSKLISSKRMTDAVDEGFEKSTGGKTAQFKEKIEQFKNAFSEEIKVGDVFDIIYSPDDGISIFKNNKLKNQISGFDFKKAVFGIWLGNEPPTEELKKGMLGRE